MLLTSQVLPRADFRTIQGFFQFWNQLPLPSEFFMNEKGQRRAFEDRQLDGLTCSERALPAWEDPMSGAVVAYQNQESDDIETVGRILGADGAGNDWETLDPG